MQRAEYIHTPIKYIPQEIIYEENVTPMANNGFVYTKIVKGVYGITQDEILANKNLSKHLKIYG